ncbi:hypothetical protein LC087_10840 [Bacillus carboniphilus]|uniref:Uncharacterized protein n=1 Tax=Bacillus carboniphilus TaxID=86663 RepID=A0ABY9JPS2_9BACI|nr:hypothetical protein [Bacillus carboniphilus]WLR41404.1 hypothetical protein LC087_10840 [Bacillus carboniphilus]
MDIITSFQDYVKTLILILLGLNWLSILLFLLAEWPMKNYYEGGIIEKPQSILDSITNFVFNILLGSGYILYKKFQKYHLINRKLFLLLSAFLSGVLYLGFFIIATYPFDFISGILV